MSENSEEGRSSALEYIKVLYSMKEFVTAFNKHFINFGLDPEKMDYNHYPFMR